MNERIRELAVQAGAMEVKHNTNIPEALSLNGEEIKNFAMLIIRECALTVQDFVDHRFPASEYPSRLKKHFGVKE